MERTIWFGDGGSNGLRHTCPGNARRLSAGGGTRGNIRAYLPFCGTDGKACSEPELQSSICSSIRCGEFFDRTNGPSICSSIRDGSTNSCPKSSVTILSAQTHSLFQSL